VAEPNQLVRIGDVAAELGLSVSWIRQLADAEAIPSTRSSGGQRLFDLGEVRAALARRALPLDPLTAAEEAKPSWTRELTLLGLSEDVVWGRVKEDLGLLADSPARRIMGFAFTEMLNNAIDHSGSETTSIKWWITPDQWTFEIRDHGVGAFPKLRVGLDLASDFEAVQELSKGKRTTDRVNHTGQGIFFTSKAVDIFRLTSSGIRWTVDNLRNDEALGVAPLFRGTSVECQVDPETQRDLPAVFGQFTNEDAAFVLTRPVVKLFEIGTSFVSRSEAKRLLDGLDVDFEAVEVDFSGVTDVGQGFVDELLRVWPNAHPGKTVTPINMNPAVEFMIRRGLPRPEGRDG
jgi:anti-sigma regulatory factor (Ser/Thr protein kinase)/predicted DNA-binding transcriptional regulator AlpA